ncbi:MAG: AMP-binding protein [Promethearchaeota archaeon]|nr:MAG: AMP-binding protein [Candidatus Lokiarchaeota archaeon]
MSEYQVDENKAWFKKWWPKKTPKNHKFEKITLGEFFERQRKKYANERLMHFIETWMTYEEAGQLIDSLATSLHKLGVKKGDVVAFLMPNCFQYVISYYASVKLGAIATGINPTYKPLEVLHQLKMTNAKVLITLDALYGELARPIINKTNVEMVIYTNVADLASGLSGIKKTLGKMIGKIPKGKVDFPSAINFLDLLNVEPDLPKVEFDPIEHPATYIMTGGTTGVPKATVLTHFNLVSNAIQCVFWFGGEDPGVGDIGVLPLYHSFAMTVVMNAAIALGGWMMLFPRPPPTGEFLKEITHINAPKGLLYAGAEILFKRIADFPDLEKFPGITGKLRLCVSGAGPLHAPVQKAFQENTKGRIVEGYGLSEASPVVSAGNLFGESPVGTIGMPFTGTDWGIFDIDDFEKGPIANGLSGSKYGEENTGEICVCGPQVMKEYLNQPEESADTLKKWDGRTWLLTGDIGFMSEDGTIAIRDRKKQLIKVAGHSVFPAEVETMLMSHEAVSEAAVAGLPDPKGKVGEITKAWVSLKQGYEGKITGEELIAWTEKNMTKWKCPAIIDIIDEIPKNILGKVQRRVLQEADPLFKK